MNTDAPPPHPAISALWPAILYLAAAAIYVLLDSVGGGDDSSEPPDDPPPPVVDITDIAPPTGKDDPIVVVTVDVSAALPTSFGKSVARLEVTAWKDGAPHAGGSADASDLHFSSKSNDVPVDVGTGVADAGIERWEATLVVDWTNASGSGIASDTYAESTSGVVFGSDLKAKFTGSEVVFPMKIEKLAGTTLAATVPGFDLKSKVVVMAAGAPFEVLAEADLDDANFRLSAGAGVFTADGPLDGSDAEIALAVPALDAKRVSVAVLLWIDGKLVTRTSTYAVE